MEERFRVLQENGYEYVGRTIQDLENQGYKVIHVPKESELGLVPLCEGADGKPVLVPGWTITVERPEPKRRRRRQDLDNPSRWLWEEWD